MKFKYMLAGLAALSMGSCAAHLGNVEEDKPALTNQINVVKHEQSVTIYKSLMGDVEGFPLSVPAEWIKWSKYFGEDGKLHESLGYSRGPNNVSMVDMDLDGKIDSIGFQFSTLIGDDDTREDDLEDYKRLDKFFAEKKKELEKDLGKSLDSCVKEWLAGREQTLKDKKE